MKLSEFILLGEVEKQSALLHLGVLIGKRKKDNSMRFLFQLNAFYVEASFNSGNKAVETFVASNSPAILDPYLAAISVDELLG